ncbi:MAG: MATE family efflux transporter [Rhodospirillales bacterium]
MTSPTAEMPSRRTEAHTVVRIAAPLAAAALAEFIMFMVTKIVVGHVGYLELAAVGLASDLAHEVLVVLMGGLTVVGVLMAHAEGGARADEVGHALRQGLLVATAVGIPAMILVLYLDAVMVWTGQDPAIIELAIPFLQTVAWMVLPVLWFSVLRIFAATLYRGSYVTWITVAAVGLNYFLAVALVEGRFGFPSMGYVGAGWAIAIASWFMLIALVAAIWLTPSMRGYGVFRGRLRIDPKVCREIVRLGIPVCAIVAIEAGLFAAVSLMSGYIGAVELATYSVIIGWVGIPFVIAHGVAEAGMIRVAYGLGRGSRAAARQSGLLAITMGCVLISMLIVVPVGFPEAVVSVFLDPGDPGFAEVAALAHDLFLIAGLFQVFDGMQVIASYSLRGIRDTVVPVLLAAVGYWVLGIGGGALLAFRLDLGAIGLWWGLALGLFTTSVMLVARFHLLTRT